ncbi:MAG: MlaD family protein [Ignavibacteria bacterium]|nr:MlaD family protein [Ignavibacteria bacterium]
MVKILSGAKLGIFIFLGSSLLVLGIFLLGNKEALFKSTFTVKAYFQNVEGLRNGAPVRLSGVDVGAVKGIKIIGEKASIIEVSMRLLSDIRKFIRTDTEAGIETEGLVGYKFISLDIKDSESEHVEDGGTILVKEPVSFADVIEETQGIMAYTKEMTKNLADIVYKINAGEGTLGKLLNDDEIYNLTKDITKSAYLTLDSLTYDLREIVETYNQLGKGIGDVLNNLNNTLASVNTILTNVKEGKGVVGSLFADGTPGDTTFSTIISNLNDIMEGAKIATIKLNENMEALKHNWLFKSYFEDRGYWDTGEYEKEIDRKTEELNEKIKLLEEKINELISLKTSSK